jgi:hypothetical protein
MLGPLNKIINETTTQIIDNDLSHKVSSVVTALVSSSFNAVNDILKKVQDLTKEETEQDNT